MPAAYGSYGVLPLVAAIPLITSVVGAGAGVATPFAQKAAAQKGEIEQLYKKLAKLQKAYAAPFSFRSKAAIARQIQATQAAIKAKEAELAIAEQQAMAAQQAALAASQPRPNPMVPIALAIGTVGVLGVAAYALTRRR